MSTDLSNSQRLIWTGQQLNQQSPLYNMAFLYELRAGLDLEKFKESFRALVREVDVLRTTFVMIGDEPSQEAQDELSFDLELLEFSGTQEDLLSWCAHRAERIFDLGIQAFDSVLLRKFNGEIAWFFNQHHLITDGWSCTVLYNRLGQIYTDSVGEELPTYSDYLKFEREVASRNLTAQNYWKEKSTRLTEPPTLYGERNNELVTASMRSYVPLGSERSARLRAVIEKPELKGWTADMTLFNVFSTVLFSFLHRVSGQNKLIFGSPSHNRLTPVFKKTPGLFIELFPMEIDMETGDSFLSVFQKTQQEANNFLRYAGPGLGSAELSRSFNVVLNYINASYEDFGGNQTKSTWIHPNHADPSHLLRLQVQDFNNTGDIQLHFDMNCGAFGEDQRKAMPGHYLKLLDAFIENIGSEIAAIPLKDESSKPVKITSLEGTVLDLFEAASGGSLQEGSLVCEHSELEKRSNDLANHLVSQGVKSGDRVVIYLRRSIDLVVSVLGVLKSGASYVPIDSNQESSRINAILDDAEPELIITSNELANRLSTGNVLTIDKHEFEESNQALPKVTPDDLAYIMYTSGSTGKPKGVKVSHGNLHHYISWAREKYQINEKSVIPFFTAIGFDLTITSLFLPLVTGAKMKIYKESLEGSDLSVIDVFHDNKSNFIKLTPAHLELLDEEILRNSIIRTMVVGGENFTRHLAEKIQKGIASDLRIFNEYGPTEATVGCMVHEFSMEDTDSSVPIGKAIEGMRAVVMDEFEHEVPDGVVGEIYLAGNGVAQGYCNDPSLTQEKFKAIPESDVHYKTGDLGRINKDGIFEYYRRKDEQLKIGGRRVEAGEIEAAMMSIPGISSVTVESFESIKKSKDQAVHFCKNCGLPSTYAAVTFDEKNICSLCSAFENYAHRVDQYFGSLDHLKDRILSVPNGAKGKYDCMALLSGGKDSTYALAKLVDLGFNVLAFTLDNGYISDEAKANVDRVVKALDVDHIYGSTPHMNEIFVDSLRRHHNVCDGCFKTIYTLSTKVALDENIPFIVTGLSRGQFFETRLTEELFRDDDLDIASIDKVVLEARRAYHQVDDSVNKLLDVDMLKEDETFEKVQYLDFYRYSDVSLDEMFKFLNSKLPWSRPSDTGRSTNCLINKAGIFVHKKRTGYSNYAFPYSWDVRLGHKTRDESLDEINEEIDPDEANQILKEIGFFESQTITEDRLIAYYLSDAKLDADDIRNQLGGKLPSYMIPDQFVQLTEFPITRNGKTDLVKLPLPNQAPPKSEVGYVAPRSEIEEILCDIWSEVLNVEKVGIYDKFLEIGGSSLAAIRIISRANQAFELELPVNLAFGRPTVASFAEFVRETIIKLLEETG